LINKDVIYPYSSERDYSRKIAVSAPVDNIRALTLIGPSTKTALRAYLSYLSHTRSEKNDIQELSLNDANSTDPFFPDQSVYLDTEPTFPGNNIDEEFEYLKNVTLVQISAGVAKVMDVEKELIRGPGRGKKISDARAVIIYTARKAGWRDTDIRCEFGFNPGSIAYHTGRLDKAFSLKEKKRILNQLRNVLSEEK
jgi:hypothetical protein